MSAIAEYMTKETRLPPYLPYPKFLLETDMTQTARLLYSLLLDRATLSQKNDWIDEDGRLYIIFPVMRIAEALDRSPMTVKNALTELEATGLIERRRQRFSSPNRIYVKIPEGQETVPPMDRKLSLIGTENCPTDGQKTVPLMDRKLSPNYLSNNNMNKNNLSRERETRTAFGEYGNVFLTETEYRKLQAEISGLDRLIDDLSGYMKSEGKTYADHAATLRRWAKNKYSKRNNSKQGIPDYTYKEGESL